MTDGEPLLRAESLSKRFETSDGLLDRLFGSRERLTAVDGIDLELAAGETLAVVGESGCGKSTLGQLLVGLLEPTAGSVTYRGSDLTSLPSSRLRELRTDLQYVFQDPAASLDPRLTVGELLAEPLEIHDVVSGERKRTRVERLLETVGLSARWAPRYPHELSGGQSQRVALARALAVEPELLICDEPVSALDVNVQAQILDLLAELQSRFDLSVLLIAHDLRVVDHLADRVGVMYLGEFVEVGATQDVFDAPDHPYTKALLSAVPEPDPGWDGDRILLPGEPPSPVDPPSGCRFHTRCPELIQPAEFGGTEAEWRSLVAFKRRLERAESFDSLVSREEPTADRSRCEFERAVRASFDIPDELSEPKIERRLSVVLEHLYEDDLGGALETTREWLRSPCEREVPTLREREDTRRVSCLQYENRE